jgi:spoIIIJ-associated protein
MEQTTHKAEELAQKATTSILSALGYQYSLEISSNEEGVELMISSPDARFLIGEDGDRLDDLQYLVNRLVQAEWEAAPRVRVDCDHYRARAEAKLLRRARSRAERVLQTGKPLLMEKLNAYQRRLVHNDLAKIPGIITESEDTESRFKRITISKKEEPCD